MVQATDNQRMLDLMAVVTPTSKLCQGCLRILTSSEFHRHDGTQDRLAPVCRHCTQSHGTHPPKDPMTTPGDLPVD